MALKVFQLSDDIAVTVYKRKLSRSIKLSIAANGEVRVSVPSWASFRSGEAFARKQVDWIAAQRNVPAPLLNGQSIGKDHVLLYKVSTKLLKPTSRITAEQIIITYPIKISPTDSAVQAIAYKAAVRALRKQAEAKLPARLRQLAAENSFTFKSVDIKQLTSRWGSCDQNQHIALNLYLMQLPWELIDYVLLHELVHTKHMDHGPQFWKTFESVLPEVKRLRTAIKKHKPVVMPVSTV